MINNTLSLQSKLQVQQVDVPEAPYPNSKGEDINTPTANRLPNVKKPDFSKIKGHACAKIPAFIDRQKRFESLSGSYYTTRTDGSYDTIEYNPEEHDGKPNLYKIVEESGIKKTVRFLNFADGFVKIDIEFNAKKNALILSSKLIVIPKKIINVNNNKEYPYEIQKTTTLPYEVIDREVTPEIISFVQEKQDIINELINYAGYYFSPKDCNIEGGCHCFIPIIIQVSMQVKHANEAKDPTANVINLFPSSLRSNSENWGEVELLAVTYTKHGEMKVIDDNVITSPSTLVTEERAIDPTEVYLHEVGHLFGFPDEYYENGGAVHKMYIKPDTQTVDIHLAEPVNNWKRKADGHLMSSAKIGNMPIFPAYYYEHFKQYFESKTGVRWEIQKLQT